MSSTAQSVFGTAELLEAVLYTLPTQDLLLAQRVCTTWRDAIQGSKKIQQALFFRPIAVVDAACGLPEESQYQLRVSQTTANRIKDDLLFHDDEAEPDDTWHEKSSLEPMKQLLGNTLAVNSDGYFNIQFFHDLPKTSTCHNMFITQPAIMSCKFTIMGKVDGIVCDFTETISEEEGITVGRLLDHVIAEWPGKSTRMAGRVKALAKAMAVDEEEMEGFQIMQEARMEHLVGRRITSVEEQAQTPHVLLRGCHELNGNAAWSWLTDNLQLDEVKECIKSGELFGEAEADVSDVSDRDDSDRDE